VEARTFSVEVITLLPSIEALLQLVDALVSFAVITGLFAAIYKIMPDVRIEWRDVILGRSARRHRKDLVERSCRAAV
jgi:uncharacterized BrkB/YihY/UPF0761 family membrane protein